MAIDWGTEFGGNSPQQSQGSVGNAVVASGSAQSGSKMAEPQPDPVKMLQYAKDFGTREVESMGQIGSSWFDGTPQVYDADKPHMGLTTWAAAPEGKIVKSDVSIAKNYLSEKEIRSLERIVSAYLDLAEDRAERHIPMTMEDWAKRLDLFLMADDREVLQDAGKITAEIAKAKAETEFEKYRVIQDRLFMSDFDKYMLS